MINVKGFDGLDLPQWMDEQTANQVCSFLNSLHQGGSQGVRFHVLRHFVPQSEMNGRMYLHLINRDKLPDVPQVQLYNLIYNWALNEGWIKWNLTE